MNAAVDSRTIWHVGMLEQDPKQPPLLSKCVWIWSPRGGGKVILPGSCSLESLPGKKYTWLKLWMSNLVWLHRWSCFKQEGWTRWPPKSLPTWIILRFFYDGDGHWHQNVSRPHVKNTVPGSRFSSVCVKELKHVFPVFCKSSWFYILTPMLRKNAAKTSFGEPDFVSIRTKCALRLQTPQAFWTELCVVCFYILEEFWESCQTAQVTTVLGMPRGSALRAWRFSL